MLCSPKKDWPHQLECGLNSAGCLLLSSTVALGLMPTMGEQKKKHSAWQNIIFLWVLEKCTPFRGLSNFFPVILTTHNQSLSKASPLTWLPSWNAIVVVIYTWKQTHTEDVRSDNESLTWHYRGAASMNHNQHWSSTEASNSNQNSSGVQQMHYSCEQQLCEKF